MSTPTSFDESKVRRDLIGRFSERHMEEGSNVSLDFAERGTLIASGRYVAPTTTTPGETSDTFWQRAFASAEYGHKQGDYPQMSDSTGNGVGRGLDGTRRRRLARYAGGGGVELRMPSATAIKNFAKENQGGTFDVPVAGNFPGGKTQGWVRVTPGARGTYEVEGLGFDAASQAYVAESVRAVLEGRRPSRALSEIPDIIAARQERLAASGANMREIRSKAIKRLGYDDSTGTMVVTFANKDGSERAYGYQIGRDAYEEVLTSESPGREYNYVVKQSGAPRVTVTNCENCGRFTSDMTAHHCTYRHGSRVSGAQTNARAAEYVASLAGESAKKSAAAPASEQQASRVAHGHATDAAQQDRIQPHLNAPDPTPKPKRAAIMSQTWFNSATSVKSEWDDTGAEGVFGDRGWTKQAVGALAPFTNAEHVGSGTNSEDSDYLRFAGVSGKQRIAHVVKNLSKGNLAMRAAEGAPRTVDILKAAYQHPDEISFGGKAVSPARTDERIEIDHVYMVSEDSEAMVKRKLAVGFPGTSEPTLERVEMPGRPGVSAWRAFWGSRG